MFLATSLVHIGQGMALVGLVLGGGFFVLTRRGNRRATGPYGRGFDASNKAMAIPLLIAGVVGVILWIVGSLR
jgi:hypothetical protein